MSLVGGGTDLPSYASRFGGAVVGTSIDIRVVVSGDADRPRRNHYRVDLATNPFAREMLRRYGTGVPPAITSFCRVPAGTGLGSSAAFCVALIAGLSAVPLSGIELAEAAAAIEIDALRRPVGKQDHYLCALGGFHHLRFARDGTVEVEPIVLRPAVAARLDAELLLFSTGVRRDAGQVLAGQNSGADPAIDRRLHQIKELSDEVADALRTGDTIRIGRAIGQHWQLKKQLSDRVSLPAVEQAYRDAIAAGATGGKILGAGGGGYLLMHAGEQAQADVRAVMAEHAMREQPFRFGRRGVERRDVSTPPVV